MPDQGLRRLRPVRLALLLLTIVALNGCRESILHDLEELRAAELQVVLLRAGVEAAKVRDGSAWAIAVQTKDAQRALEVLQAQRVLDDPPPEEPRGLLISKEERLQLASRRTAQQLERTLELLPQVRRARVHLSQHPAGLFAEPGSGTRYASALLLLEPGGAVVESEVRALLAAAAGTPQEQVSVVVGAAAAEERSPAPAAAAAPERRLQASWWLLGAAAGAALLLYRCLPRTVSPPLLRPPRSQLPEHEAGAAHGDAA